MDSVIMTKNSLCCCRYLQWLIEDQDCEDSQYHTLYAVSLAKSVMEAVYMDSRNEDKNYRDIDEMDNSSVEARNSHNHLVREKLQLFLQASDLYDPEEVLDVIEESELWLEKVFLPSMTTFCLTFFLIG